MVVQYVFLTVELTSFVLFSLLSPEVEPAGLALLRNFSLRLFFICINGRAPFVLASLHSS